MRLPMKFYSLWVSWLVWTGIPTCVNNPICYGVRVVVEISVSSGWMREPPPTSIYTFQQPLVACAPGLLANRHPGPHYVLHSTPSLTTWLYLCYCFHRNPQKYTNNPRHIVLSTYLVCYRQQCSVGDPGKRTA